MISSTTGDWASESVSPVARDAQAGRRGDVAAGDLLDVLALVGVHLEEPSDALALALRRVVDGLAGRDLPRVDAEVGQRADERVVHDLERERRERLVVSGLALDLVAIGVEAANGRDVERRRKIVDDRVEQRLHAFVLEGRAHEHRDGAASDGRAAERRAQDGLGDLLALDEERRGLVVEVGDRLDHLGARDGGAVAQLLWDLTHGDGGARRVVLPLDELHRHEIDDPREALLESVRHLNHDR